MPNTLAATGFTPAAFDAFLASRNEPGWLTDLRRDAWARFSELGMPARNDEEWSRTDIRLFKLDRFGLPDAAAARGEPPQGLLAQGVALGGQTATLDSAHDGIDARRQVGGQGRAVRRHRADWSPSMATCCGRSSSAASSIPNRDKFAALNAACWAGGALLYVPQARRRSTSRFTRCRALTDGGVDLTKTLVILDEGAEATMLSRDGERRPARRRLPLRVDRADRRTRRPAALRQPAELGRPGVALRPPEGARRRSRRTLQWTIGALGSRLAKVNQHVALTGEDAEAQVNGVMFTQGRQHLSYNTHQHHMAAALPQRLALQGGAAGRLAHRVARHDQGRPRRPEDRRLPAERQPHARPHGAGRFDSRAWKSKPTTSAARTAARAAASTSSRSSTR